MATTDIPVNLTIDPYWSKLYLLQRDFQVRILDAHPKELSPREQMEYLREQSLALIAEVHEALAETGWKSWASSMHINREAFKGELADVFCFFMNLMMVADITPAELMDATTRKIKKNHERQDNAYDGVSTKCSQCKRAYDDDAVECTPAGITPQGLAYVAWCDVKQIGF